MHPPQPTHAHPHPHARQRTQTHKCVRAHAHTKLFHVRAWENESRSTHAHTPTYKLGCAHTRTQTHTCWCIMGAEAGEAAGAPSGAFSWTTRVSLPPMSPSTARCAKALPVPIAAPARMCYICVQVTKRGETQDAPTPAGRGILFLFLGANRPSPCITPPISPLIMPPPPPPPLGCCMGEGAAAREGREALCEHKYLRIRVRKLPCLAKESLVFPRKE